jgi:F-type H+-transporting ATPase subunit epsilon
MPHLDVHLVTPEREVWRGTASYVLVRSVDGDLGVLPEHAPTLAALDVGPVSIETEGGRVAAVVDGGFLHVGPAEHARERSDADHGRPAGAEDAVTRVDILAEHALLADELDREDPAAYDARAEELDAEGRHAEARVERAKAVVRRRLTQEQR